MAKWARIENDTVIEITDIDPAGRFHPDLVWISVVENVEPGWVKNGPIFQEPSKAEIVLPGPILDAEAVDISNPVNGLPSDPE